MHDRRLAAVPIDDEYDLEEMTGEAGLDRTPMPLPGCALRADADLVEEAAGRLKIIALGTVAKGMAEMGAYLLDTFYDGKPDLYRSAAPRKHASLRLLMERCESVDVPVSRSLLARALMIAVRIRELPCNSAFNALPPSHQAELVRIRSVEKVEKLAERARTDRMSVMRLRAAVRKAVPKSNRGRKPTPEVVRVLSACVRGLRDDETGRLALRKEQVLELTDAQLAHARELVGVLLRRTEDLARLLG